MTTTEHEPVEDGQPVAWDDLPTNLRPDAGPTDWATEPGWRWTMADYQWGPGAYPPPPVHILWAWIVDELPAIGRNRRNEQQSFDFRGIDDVLNALNPLLGRYGVTFRPRVLERTTAQRTTRNGTVNYEVNLHVAFDVVGPAGDSFVIDAWGEGTDAGDKATNKATTGAYKYALFPALAIATEDMSRNDQDGHPTVETVAAGQVDPRTTDEWHQARGWDSYEAHEQYRARFIADARRLERGLQGQLRGFMHDRGMTWPITVAQANELDAWWAEHVEAAERPFDEPAAAGDADEPVGYPVTHDASGRRKAEEAPSSPVEAPGHKLAAAVPGARQDGPTGSQAAAEGRMRAWERYLATLDADALAAALVALDRNVPRGTPARRTALLVAVTAAEGWWPPEVPSGDPSTGPGAEDPA
jgi:hypothetical protein